MAASIKGISAVVLLGDGIEAVAIVIGVGIVDAEGTFPGIAEAV